MLGVFYGLWSLVVMYTPCRKYSTVTYKEVSSIITLGISAALAGVLALCFVLFCCLFTLTTMAPREADRIAAAQQTLDSTLLCLFNIYEWRMKAIPSPL